MLPMPHLSASHQALTVLLVEPSPMLAERLLRLVMSRHGVAAALASSVDEAITQLRIGRFALVAVDLDAARDPDLSGVRRLRATAPGSHFMVLTADPDPETLAACRDLGADTVLPLAHGLRRVVAVLDELLAARGLQLA